LGTSINVNEPQTITMARRVNKARFFRTFLTFCMVSILPLIFGSYLGYFAKWTSGVIASGHCEANNGMRANLYPIGVQVKE